MRHHKNKRKSVIKKTSDFETVRGAVWLLTYGQETSASHVARIFDVNPQDPKTLMRYRKRFLESEDLSEFASSFGQLELSSHLVPLAVRHYCKDFKLEANQKWEFERPFDCNARKCREVGDTCTGSYGAFICTAVVDCHCPNGLGQIAVVERDAEGFKAMKALKRLHKFKRRKGNRNANSDAYANANANANAAVVVAVPLATPDQAIKANKKPSKGKRKAQQSTESKRKKLARTATAKTKTKTKTATETATTTETAVAAQTLAPPTWLPIDDIDVQRLTERQQVKLVMARQLAAGARSSCE